MKLFLVSAAAAALIFAAPAAFADPPDHHGKPAGGSHSSGGSHGTMHAAAPKGPAAPKTTTHMGGGMGIHTPQTMQTKTRNHGMMKTTASPGAVFNAQTRSRNVGNNNNRNNNGSVSRTNNRGSTNVRINFNRHNVTASRHYHYSGGAYRGPSGYSYRRWSYGQTLPSIYWARNYWITDYSDYGLAYPPPGCAWVRYGNDAILIDEDSGEILEVVYGQFY